MFKPPKWAYEPMTIARQRAQSEFTRLRDEVSPLVAKGDSLSLLRAQQLAQQAQQKPEHKAERKNAMLTKIRDSVRAAAEQAKSTREQMGALPPELQQADDRQHLGRPVPGVPRGVAEAFPETATGRVYDSGSSGPTGINPLASLVDNREGLPGPVNRALDTPVLGRALTEVARPANYVPIGPGGIVRNLAQNVGGTLAGQAASDAVPDSAPAPVKFGAGLVGAIAGGGAADLATAGIKRGAPEALRGAGKAAIAYRDITENIPVGASIKDVSGGLPEDAAGGAAPSFQDALDGLRNAVRTETRLRNTGVVEGEIRAGRSAQFRGVRQSLEHGVQSGLSGEALARQTRAGAATGGLRRTVAEPVMINQAQRDALFDELMTNIADPTKDAPGFLTATQALQKALDGHGLQPHEIRALQPLLGHDIMTALIDRAPKTAGESAGVVSRTVRGAGPRLPGAVDMPTTAGGVPAAGRASKAQDLLRNPRAEQQRVSGIKAEARSRAAQELKANGPTEDALMAKVDELLNTETRTLDLPGNPTVKAAKPQVRAVIDQWLQGNRDILDNMGPEGSQILQNVNAQLSGNVADSYLTAALTRRNILADSLRRSWGEPADAAAGIERDKIISKTVDALFQRELKIRYGNTVPDHVKDLLKTTASLPYDESLGALSTLTQRAKNTMFGVMDVGVFGVQGLNAIRRGGIPLFASMINRGLAAAHMPNVATTYADSMLPKQIQYGLDGVAQGAVTGAFSRRQGAKEVGSLFQYLGPLGRAVDRPYMAAADKMSQVQFGTVLGGLRNAAYEGDLVMAHLLGQDIMKPSVRRVAAGNANAIGSFAQSALRKSRAQKESVLLVSAPMMRARINSITQMAKVFGPKANPTERIVGAMMIASTVGYTLATGKLLNDWIGVGDFEFDPSKPGFGQITLSNGTVISTVPQGSVERAFSRSIRAIAETDPTAAAKAWSDMYLGSAGPVPRVGLAAADVGYQPGAGYKYGDLGGNKVLNLVPLPPVLQSRLNNQDQSLDQFALGEVGVNTFKESARTKAERVFAQENNGAEWKTATTDQADAFKAQHPDIAQGLIRDAVSAPGKFGEAARVQETYRGQQEAADAQLIGGQMKREEWVDAYYTRQAEKSALFSKIYGDKPITNPKDPMERYVQILQQSEDPDTKQFDPDKFDAGMASLSKADREYIDSHVGKNDTDLAAKFRDVRAVRKERNALPKYRGYDADQAQQIDEVWQEVRNNARSADTLDMRRALRMYLGGNSVDPAIVAGVQRRISGRLRQTTDRTRFDRAHPEQDIFYGRGRLTPAEIASLAPQQKAA